MIKKIKNFIHKHETLEKMILFGWGVFFIIRARLIFRKIKQGSAKEKFPKVLILALRAIPTTNLVYFDAIFGHAFKKLGCDVKMLYCDGFLDSCDANTVFRNQKPQCFVCKKLGSQVRNSLNLDCAFYRQYISEPDIERIKGIVADMDDKELLNYEYLGVNVGKHAFASAVRYFLFGRIDLNNPKEVYVLRKKLVSAMIAAKVAENVYLKEKPDVLFMLHGIYSAWGPFRDYYNLKGVDTVIYVNMPPRFGHFLFNRNTKPNDIVSKASWDEFKNKILQREQEVEIDDYLNRRRGGGVGDQEMYKDNFKNEKKNKVLKLILENKYSRRYVMYPNVAWDVVVEGRASEIFDDVFAWVDATIKFFQEKRNYQLITKPHPAELVLDKCSKGIKDFVTEKYSPLPPNIVLLEADVPFNAHELVDGNTVAIVFNGTVGLELASRGVPVLAVADIHYKDAGVVCGIKTLDDYLGLLDNPDKLISFAKNNTELAKKFAYFYFFKSMIRIPFYKDDRWSTIDWGVVGDTEKLLGDDSNIIKICKKIINREDIVYDGDFKKFKKNHTRNGVKLFICHHPDQLLLYKNLIKIIKKQDKAARIILLKVNHPYFSKFNFGPYNQYFDEVIDFDFISYKKNFLTGYREIFNFQKKLKKTAINLLANFAAIDLFMTNSAWLPINILLYNLARQKNIKNITKFAGGQLECPQTKTDNLKTLFCNLYSLPLKCYKVKVISNLTGKFQDFVYAEKTAGAVVKVVSPSFQLSKDLNREKENILPYPVISERSSAFEKDIVIVFGDANIFRCYFEYLPDYEIFIQKMANFFKALEKEYSDCKIYYKPHPNNKERIMPGIDIKRYNLFDNTVNAQTLIDMYQKRIKAVYTFSSTSVIQSSFFAIPSYTFYKYLFNSSGIEILDNIFNQDNVKSKFLFHLSDLKEIGIIDNLEPADYYINPENVDEKYLKVLNI